MGLERKIAFAGLGCSAVGVVSWGLKGLDFTVPPIIFYVAILIGSIGAVLLAGLLCQFGWILARSRGLQLGPAIGIVIGSAILLPSLVWGVWTWAPSRQSSEVTRPNISFQNFALFWVETEKEVYQLGVVAKLFNAEGKSYLLNGLTFDTTAWKLVPRGSYYISRALQFPDRIELIENNYIKPDDVGYFKKLLPISFEMTIVGGDLPDLLLKGQWHLILGEENMPVEPRFYTAYKNVLSVQEWGDLLKPKSQINVDNLTYQPIPKSITP